MPRRISDVLGTTREALEIEGALDGFADIDAQFHFDPHLLRSTSVPEFSTSHTRLENHFDKIIRLLDASRKKGDRFYRQAVSMLMFPEIHEIKLGYATGNSLGKGIGPGLASQIADTATEIVSAGIKDPVIFELVGLFEDNVGADRISDMTVQIILPDILRFSQRVATNLSVNTVPYEYQGETYRLLFDSETRRMFALVPCEILRDLPVALDWEDIDIVASYNQQLRDKVNQIIGSTWKKAQKRLSKRDLKSALLEFPELIYDLIEQYRGKKNKQYDFARDPTGELIWADIAKEFADRYPISLALEPGAPIPVLETVTTICNRFKKLTEDNGLNRLLYDDSHKLRHERFAQLLFYGIADIYCEANNLDINREPNAGNGPLDFKFSRGYPVRVNVEVKYSSNPKLLHGYRTQLPLYNQSETAFHSIYLVIRTTKSDRSIKSLISLHNRNKNKGMRVPKIIVIDGRIKKSASKR